PSRRPCVRARGEPRQGRRLRKARSVVVALARCGCGQVFDIPGLYRSYKQPDGRCAKCNGVSGVPSTMDIPNNVVHAFKVDTSISMPDIEEIKVETGVPLVQKKGSAVKGRRKSIYPF